MNKEEIEKWLQEKYNNTVVQYERLNAYYKLNKDLPEEAKNTIIYNNNRATGIALLYLKRFIEETAEKLGVILIRSIKW